MEQGKVKADRKTQYNFLWENRVKLKKYVEKKGKKKAYEDFPGLQEIFPKFNTFSQRLGDMLIFDTIFKTENETVSELQAENGNLTETIEVLTADLHKTEKKLGQKSERISRLQSDLDAVGAEKEEVNMDIIKELDERDANLRAEIKDLKKLVTDIAGLSIPAMPDVKHAAVSEVPDRIGGWSISANKKGYYTAAKHVPPGTAEHPKGGTLSVHLGSAKKAGSFSEILRSKLTEKGLQSLF